MRWVFVAFVVCVAVAAENIYDAVNSFGEGQNNIDIFLPKPFLNRGQSLDRIARAFYYSYWLYPGMYFQPRVPYMDYDYVEPLTFQDVFEKPVFVVTPSQYVPNSFSTFYLHSGLRTLHIHNTFTWLQEFFRHSGLKGLIFFPHLMYNVRFSNTAISSLTLPENLKMSEFVSIQECHNGKIPYMFVAPEDLFDRMHFENIAKVSDFKVYNDAIEVHPVVAQPRPVYEPFYGPQSQGHPNVLPQPSSEISESHSSMNNNEFRSNVNQLIEPPQVLIQSEKLVASEAERGAHEDERYAGQYGYVQNQGTSDQYNVNYLQGKSVLNQQASRMVNAPQDSSNFYNHGAITRTQVSSEAQLNAANGVNRDLYGDLSGSKVGKQSASMVTPGARFGQSHTGAELQTGQVSHFGATKESGNINNQGAQVGISRVEGGSISGHLSGMEGAKLSGSQSIEGSVPNSGNVLRTDSGITQSQRIIVSSEGASLVGVSGQQPVDSSASSGTSGSITEAGSLSRANSASLSSEQIHITFPKEGGLGGLAGVTSQGTVSSETISRTGAQTGKYVTESQAFDQSKAQSSGSSLQGGHLVRSETANLEDQAGAQGSVSASLNSGSISRTNTGGVEQVTETFIVSGSTDQNGNLVRSDGNFGLGGGFGLSGNIGGKFGFSGSIGGGLNKLGAGIVKNIDVTTHGLGINLLRHHDGELEQHQQSGGSTVSKSVVSTSNVETSTVSEPIQVVKSARSFVSSSRFLNEDKESAEPISPTMMAETIAA